MDYGDPRLPERYWAKVYPCPVTGCWLWGAAQHDTLAYGVWRIGGRNARAHVSAFLANGGELTVQAPNVLHSCDQASCVWPDHLRAGSQAENMADARQRRRLRVGKGSPLNAAMVTELRERYAAGESASELAAEFGVSQPSISMIVRGLRWPNAGGPLTHGRRLGSPSPAREKPACKYGHARTPETVTSKPNPACRSGFELVCIPCRKRRNREQAARRKAARAVSRGLRSA